MRPIFRPGTSEIIAVGSSGVVRTWSTHGLASRRKLEDDGQLQFGVETFLEQTGRYAGGATLGTQRRISRFDFGIWPREKPYGAGGLDNEKFELMLPNFKLASIPDGKKGFNLIDSTTKRSRSQVRKRDVGGTLARWSPTPNHVSRPHRHYLGRPGH